MSSWRYTIARHEAALREYYATFPWRTLAVRQFVQQLLEKWRANPLPRPGPRINDSETYVGGTATSKSAPCATAWTIQESELCENGTRSPQ
jgi:hypothetical protein